MSEANWIEAGLLLRGSLRRELIKAGITFTETKAGLSSVFIIPDKIEYKAVCQSLRNQGFVDVGR